MSDLTPWPWTRFMAEMRRAGYKGMGQGCYVHQQTERKFYCWTFEDGVEAWRPWAEAQQVPPPF